jgi:hypothetical protein
MRGGDESLSVIGLRSMVKTPSPRAACRASALPDMAMILTFAPIPGRCAMMARRCSRKLEIGNDQVGQEAASMPPGRPNWRGQG